MDTSQAPSHTVERALVSVPAPDIAQRRFSVLNTSPKDSSTERIAKQMARRETYALYYMMYRQHPIARAAIEKVAKVSVNNGYSFSSVDPDKKAPKRKKKELELFFRRSNAIALLRLTIKDLYIYGESFWWVEFTKGGKPFRAKRLHPGHLSIKLSADGTEVEEYRYGESFGQDKSRKYKPNEIIHFKFEDPDDDVRGLSLLESLTGTVATDLFAIEYNGKFFENSAQTGTIFNMENATPDEIERNREYMEAEYVGAENAHKPLILEGNIKVQKSVATAAEMQFVEGRRVNRQDILATLDVQPEKLGITESSNRSVGKESDNTFREEAVGSVHIVVEEVINNDLILGRFGYDNIIFGLKLNSKRDLLDQMALWNQAEMSGVISPNHVRNEMGLPPVKGGDQLFIQTAAGLIPLMWIDDVAKRLIAPGDATLGGRPTPQQQPNANDPQQDPQDQQAGSGDPNADKAPSEKQDKNR